MCYRPPIFVILCLLSNLLFDLTVCVCVFFSAGHQQKVITATVTPESYAVVPSSIQIHNPASLSNFKTPAVYATSSNQEQTNQSSLRSLSAAVNSPCFPHLNLNQTINN